VTFKNNPIMEEKTITAYITKYALTRGIVAITSRLRVGSDLITTNEKYPQYLHKGNWFSTEEEAKVDAENRRKKKIASLKKQIEKLEKLKF